MLGRLGSGGDRGFPLFDLVIVKSECVLAVGEVVVVRPVDRVDSVPHFLEAVKGGLTISRSVASAASPLQRGVGPRAQ